MTKTSLNFPTCCNLEVSLWIVKSPCGISYPFISEIWAIANTETSNSPVCISTQPYHPLSLTSGQWRTGRKGIKKTLSGPREGYPVTPFISFVLSCFPLLFLFIRCLVGSPEQGVPGRISRADRFTEGSTLLTTSRSLLLMKLKCMWKTLYSD